MKITVQTSGFEASRKLKAFVRKNVSKLEKLYAPIMEANVSLKIVNDAAVQNRVCEIKLVVPGNDLFVSKPGETFETATHEAIDALKHQVDRLRTNWDSRRGALV